MHRACRSDHKLLLVSEIDGGVGIVARDGVQKDIQIVVAQTALGDDGLAVLAVAGEIAGDLLSFF